MEDEEDENYGISQASRTNPKKGVQNWTWLKWLKMVGFRERRKMERGMQCTVPLLGFIEVHGSIGGQGRVG